MPKWNEGRNKTTTAYNVYLFGKLFDTVWFTGYTAEEARLSLIGHDGYDYRITVRKN